MHASTANAATPAMPESSIDVAHWWRQEFANSESASDRPIALHFHLGVGDVYDGSMMNGLQAVESWRDYFGSHKGSTLGLFNAAYPIGSLCAIPFISFISDGFGRRVALATKVTLCCIGAALQAGAANLPMFVVARGLLGCGTVFLGLLGAPLITEKLI
ncbi:hypothetical protein B0J14DRAFT_642392 [Halenospora varia]|nr:hypothetical protein B0J14DRAFT_642392 [Halenospora varia]